MSTEYDGLDPIEQDDGLRLNLEHKETERGDKTIQPHRFPRGRRGPDGREPNGPEKHDDQRSAEGTLEHRRGSVDDS